MMKPENMTILTVDDTPANIRLLTHYLEKQGYQVITAEDGFEGFKAAIQHHPDLVLLDIMMPGTDGYEVCELLKAEEETKDIPVVFLTAKTDVEDKVRGFELGAVDYITKPFNLVEIAARVQTQLNYKYLQNQIKRFYQVFKQSMNIPPIVDAKLKLAGNNLNQIFDNAQQQLKSIERKDTDGSLVKKEFEKTLQNIEEMIQFIQKDKYSELMDEHSHNPLNLNMLLEDIIDILQNEDSDEHLFNIHYQRFNQVPVVSGNLARLQMGLLDFFIHHHVKNKQCSVDINLAEAELPKNVSSELKGESDDLYYCIGISSRDIKVNKEDLQNNTEELVKKDMHINFGIINLQSVIKNHRGAIDVSSTDTKGTKVNIYLPKL